VAVDSSGNIYFADTGNHRIRKVDTAGVVTTFAGVGQPGFGGDGAAATSALLSAPADVALDGTGNLYIADVNNERVRKVSTLGVITTVAGNGLPGFAGDTGLATAARLDTPISIALDAAGNLYIVDANNKRIRKVDGSTGFITTFAGTGTPAYRAIDENVAANTAQIDPLGVAVDNAGNVYIADTGNNRIRKVDGAGLITTVAGNGSVGFAGDGGPAVSAHLDGPTRVSATAAGSFLIADGNNFRIRVVDQAGTITTLAGNGVAGSAGDGGDALAAEMESPGCLTVDAAGATYITDTWNHRVRKVK
jgi:sugar lactone lactonase YvrE